MILEKAKRKQLEALGKPYERSSIGRPVTSKQGMNLKTVKGPIKLSKQITLEGISQIRGNQKQLHVVAEPLAPEGAAETPELVTVPTYSVCMLGSHRVFVIVQNVTNDVITPRIAKLTATYLIPNKMAPHYVGEKSEKVIVKMDQTKKGQDVS